jgi:hypothetical protein
MMTACTRALVQARCSTTVHVSHRSWAKLDRSLPPGAASLPPTQHDPSSGPGAGRRRWGRHRPSRGAPSGRRVPLVSLGCGECGLQGLPGRPDRSPAPKLHPRQPPASAPGSASRRAPLRRATCQGIRRGHAHRRAEAKRPAAWFRADTSHPRAGAEERG